MAVKKVIAFSELGRGESADLDRVGKVSGESVRKHTGKDWRAWIPLLEKAGARAWTYREIVAYLAKRHRLTPWWQQGVALGFEIATGRRQAGQDAKGKYGVTATKSLGVSATALWKTLLSAPGVDAWLKPIAKATIRPEAEFETEDGYFGEIRTLAAGRRLRAFWRHPDWEKHTVLELMLVPKPGGKSILAFNHTGIADAPTRDRLRARWRAAAEAIASLIASGG